MHVQTANERNDEIDRVGTIVRSDERETVEKGREARSISDEGWTTGWEGRRGGPDAPRTQYPYGVGNAAYPIPTLGGISVAVCHWCRG